MKYNLNDLHWQQFEIFSFQCLQKLVSPSIQFLDGGNDRGRDIIYEGASLNFHPSWSGKWIFQMKHKSFFSNDQTKSINTLVSDLKDELFKVHVKEKIGFDNYILVTNLTVTSTFQDKAQRIFSDFCESHSLKDKNFLIIGYRHFESCIDANSSLKWIFPNILNHPDFQLLISSISDSIVENRNRGWFNSISKYRKFFVYTKFYDEASSKLENYHAILLSGPPKGGKTFNAEMLVFNFVVERAFKPIKIDDPEEIERFYRQEFNQIFLCDDAFGSQRLSYASADEWNRKIEGILSLANVKHKFVFTSREHVFNAFRNFATNFKGNYLEKIVVNNQGLSYGEKSAILERYVQLSNLNESIKKSVLENEDDFITHKCFSPETIRSFFANLSQENSSKYTIYHHLISHLNKPDEYISDLFFQLEQTKRILLLGVLCSHSSDIKEIGKTYHNLCNDFDAEKLDSYKTILEELDGGILKTIQTTDSLEVQYYHPTMKEGLIHIIKEDENGTIHGVIIKNLNVELLESCYFDSPKTKKKNDISIKQGDLDSLSVSIKRFIKNEKTQFHHIIRLLKWFSTDNSDSLIKVLDKPFYSLIKRVILDYIEYLKTEDFWIRFKNESISRWAELAWSVKSLALVYSLDLKLLYSNYWLSILDEKKNDPDYWKFVFRILSFVDPQVIYDRVGRAWLNDFYKELRSKLYELGYEVFGIEFPSFKTYNSLTPEERNKINENQKLKYKPNRTWYPRFLICKDKVTHLKDLKGNEIGQQILSRIEREYEELLRYSDYASNRQAFNEEQNWW